MYKIFEEVVGPNGRSFRPVGQVFYLDLYVFLHKLRELSKHYRSKSNILEIRRENVSSLATKSISNTYFPKIIHLTYTCLINMYVCMCNCISFVLLLESWLFSK